MAMVQWSQRTLAHRQSQLAEARSPELARQLIKFIKAPSGWGVYASVGPNYQYTIFGRDSIEFADDMLHYCPDISHEIILAIGRLQGSRTDDITEEQPGKIHHEYRALQFNEQPISPAAARIYNILRHKWSQPGTNELRYYGSVDATPLFINLVDHYVARYGTTILSEQLQQISGEVVTIAQVLQRAVEWMVTSIEASPWGLLEFKRRNPNGLPYQSWKDSDTAFLHTNGQPAYADGGIAAVEVQGFAYDALQAGTRLVLYSSERKRYILQIAETLAKNTIKFMWLKEHHYFAAGLDRDAAGRRRRIATLTSNPGLLLQTNLLKVLPLDTQHAVVGALVERLMSKADFLTPAGIRCRSLRHAHLLQYADYHGSLVSWPKDSANIADGLRAWGYHTEATEIENYVTESIIEAGDAYEFFYVDVHNHAKLHYRIENNNEPTFHTFGAANLPEPMQAWSLACFLKIQLQKK